MSDIPELDRLLDEHEIFRRNMDWHWRQMVGCVMLRCAVAFCLMFIICGMARFWGLLALPFVCAGVAKFIPKPILRDPFRRYMYK